MRAYKCDMCGTLIEGSTPTSGEVLTREVATKGWPRELTSVTVSVRVTPHGDPSGYGGIELCADCGRQLVATVSATGKQRRRTK